MCVGLLAVCPEIDTVVSTKGKFTANSKALRLRSEIDGQVSTIHKNFAANDTDTLPSRQHVEKCCLVVKR